MTQRLPLHEWLIISLLISILLALVVIAYIGGKRALPLTNTPYELIRTDIQVSIKGAVAKPGTYTLKKGALLEELLELAQPNLEADLRRLRPQSPLRDGQYIRVLTKPMITIFLEGAIKEQKALQVVKGTKMEDLVGMIEFLPEADIKKIQKRRCLKDQEIVYIPIKKEKKRQKRLESDY